MTTFICIVFAAIAALPMVLFTKTLGKGVGISIYGIIAVFYSFVIYSTYGTEGGGLYTRVVNLEWKNDYYSDIKLSEGPLEEWAKQNAHPIDSSLVDEQKLIVVAPMSDGDDFLLYNMLMNQRTLSDDVYDTATLFLYSMIFFLLLTAYMGKMSKPKELSNQMA